MSAVQQKQSVSQLNEQENYHDSSKYGFFSLLSRDDDGMNQHSHPLQLLPQVRTLIDPSRDTYISQAEFNKRDRKIVNLLRIGLLFLDLDYYHHAELKHLTPEQVAYQVVDFCNFEGIPQPSAIVSSGRGLYLKWFLTKAVPAQALPRWNCIMATLVARFSYFSADPRARDASRVLRLEGTINEKSGELVRVIHYSGQTHDFEDLARELLPVSREVCKEHRKNQIERSHLKLIQGNGNKTGLQKLSPTQLNWDRLGDLRTLAELRGGVEPGSRDTFLFLATCFMSWVVSDVYPEVAELCRQFAPGLPLAEARSYTSTALARAKDAHAGKLEIYQGLPVDPRYRFKNQTIIDWLQITSSEERQLKTIISKTEAAERHRQRNRKHTSRANYSAIAEDRKCEALELRAKGMSQRQIAAELGVSRGAVENYLRN